MGPVLLLLLLLLMVPPLAVAPLAVAGPNPAVYANPIVRENQHPGSSLWRLGTPPYQVSDDRAQQIKGYASAPSVNKGEPITFYISTNPPQPFSLDLYRIGYYDGAGGRLMQHLTGDGLSQPSCPEQPETGLIACDWSPTLTYTIPATWTSGIYVGLLTNASNYQDYIQFVVRDDARPSAILYQQGVLTYQAYNNYPADGLDGGRPVTGKSLYRFNSSLAPTRSIDGARATKVSFDRPYASPPQSSFLDWDLYTVEWLEQRGYDVTYTTDVDTHVDPSQLLQHRAFLSAGHDEYWTKPMYDAVVAARDAGVNLGFLGANAIFWQARLEPSARGVPNRVVVVYRRADLDPTTDPSLTTVNWRDPPLNRPEQTLIGVQYASELSKNAPFMVSGAGSSWVYQGTGLVDGETVPAANAQQPDGGGALVGYEADGYDPKYPLPAHRSWTLLSVAPFTDTFGKRQMSNASIYQAEQSGAWVFASGTMSWSWALARPGYVNEGIQRMTQNVMDTFVASPIAASGGVTESPAPRGSSMTINATVRNTRPATVRILVDVAVVAADGSTTFQQVFDDQVLAPGELRSFSIPWTVPADAAPGPHTLIVAAFGPNWAPLQPWSDWTQNGTALLLT